MISPWAADVLGAVASPPEAVDSSLDWAVFSSVARWSPRYLVDR